MKKFHYKFNFTVFAFLLLIFVFAACNQTSAVKDQNGCKYLVSFENDEWKGVVTNKYLDQTLNNSGVIQIVNDSVTHKISDSFLSNSANYELITIGDSIEKIKGELIVHLYNSSGATKLETDFDCDDAVEKKTQSIDKKIDTINVLEKESDTSDFYIGKWKKEDATNPIDPTFFEIKKSDNNGYKIQFSNEEDFYVNAKIDSNNIIGSSNSGNFIIELISKFPPVVSYSDDGRGHFEPVRHERFVKV